MHVVFPKRSVILLWLFLLLPLAALLLYSAYSFIFIMKYIIPYHLQPAVNRQPMFPRGWPEELAEFPVASWSIITGSGRSHGIVKYPHKIWGIYESVQKILDCFDICNALPDIMTSSESPPAALVKYNDEL